MSRIEIRNIMTRRNRVVSLFSLLLTTISPVISRAQENNGKVREIEIISSDSLRVSAKVYEINKTSPTIVLCHQAGYNKFEYDGIAPELNKRGFNAIAVDQRMGGDISSAHNGTYLRAIEKNKTIDLAGSERDIVAAIDYAAKTYGKKVILWGSSYSSTLALYLAKEKTEVVAVVSFSPGNYLKVVKGSLVESLTNYEKPFFITCAKQEIPGVKELLTSAQLNEYHVFFEPKSNGRHGSSALWDYPYETNEYWAAIDKFLKLVRNKVN